MPKFLAHYREANTVGINTEVRPRVLPLEISETGIAIDVTQIIEGIELEEPGDAILMLSTADACTCGQLIFGPNEEQETLNPIMVPAPQKAIIIQDDGDFFTHILSLMPRALTLAMELKRIRVYSDEGIIMIALEYQNGPADKFVAHDQRYIESLMPLE